MKRIERTRKPRKCPQCEHTPVGEILWGMPHMDSKLEELMDAGKVIIGGCCLGGEDPT